MQKSIKELALDISEEEYRKLDAYNYSVIAKFAREGFRKIGSLFEPTPITASLSFGSLLDSIITNKGVHDDRFSLQEDIKCSDKVSSIIKALIGEYGDTCVTIEDIEDEDINRIAKEFDYYRHERYDSLRVKKIKSEGGKLYERFRDIDGIFVTQKDLIDAVACYDELIHNPYTCRYLMDYDDDSEAYYQLKFQAQYKGTDVKGMFDRLIVSHEDKVIIPVDFKTTGDEDKFVEAVFKWRYDIQARLYTYILQEVISKDEYFRDFTIAPFVFVVINRFNRTPLVWEFLVPKNIKASLTDLEGNSYESWTALLNSMTEYIGLYQVGRGGYSTESILSDGHMTVPFIVE